MKNIIVIFLLTFSVNMFSQSFPDSNAIWNVSGNLLYGLDGDTVINDTTYSKLYTLKDLVLEKEYFDQYIGGIRNEGKKVWFKPAIWNHENILLYDFGAQAGDSIAHNGFTYDGYSFEYAKTYSYILSISNSTYKEYRIIKPHGIYEEYWYEGIGDNLGLFGSIIFSFPLSGSHPNLACYKHNDTLKYQNFSVCGKCLCGPYSGINEYSNESDLINVYPNPANKDLTIKVEETYSKIQVQISDESGKVIYKKDSLEDCIKIDAFTPGVYFVTLIVDDKIITKTIVVE